MVRDGGSSGGTSDNEPRGPEFDSCLELVFSLPFSSLPLNHWCALNQVPHGSATQLIFSTFQVKNGGLAVQLEVKQAHYALIEQNKEV